MARKIYEKNTSKSYACPRCTLNVRRINTEFALGKFFLCASEPLCLGRWFESIESAFIVIQSSKYTGLKCRCTLNGTFPHYSYKSEFEGD